MMFRSTRRLLFLILFLLVGLIQHGSFAAMTRSAAMQELGLKKDYTEKDLKSAYRKRSLETHPDKGGSNEQFIRVAEAYELLSTGGSGTFGTTTGGAGTPDAEEAMRRAEDMFFDMFEEFFEGGQVADMIVDKIFGTNLENLTWSQRQMIALGKKIGRGLVTKVSNFVMESDSITINVNGQPMTSADLRAWRDKMKKRRQAIKDTGSSSSSSDNKPKDDTKQKDKIKQKDDL